jgi:hypothetical protein
MSDPQRPSPITLIAAAIFAALLLSTHGNLLIWTNDEGIIVDASLRMLNGQTLYRDSFGYMTPGSYWLQEAAYAPFWSLHSIRPHCCYPRFRHQCAVLFWLTAFLAGKKAAFAATIPFAAFQATWPDFLLAQHRMDSSAAALLSIVLCV